MAFILMKAIFNKFKTQDMHYVYVLISEIKSLRFYVGMSEDFDKRLLDHNKGYRPWKLFFTEEYKTRLEARKREKYLKSGTGKEKIKKKWADSNAKNYF